ncbi:MAG: FKBP-type peptidyl-prolyl cis-trans isomerase [Elusimicrobiota bacterium]|jgi:FKBP-type peptidyl-prolyl cis-trans isomerase|nr:FKBP-type peptidyl-prolyl cis-trans isomerase [Elusimicrobiota bacterium]
MKKLLILATICFALHGNALAQNTAPKTKAPAASANVNDAKTLYSLGYLLGDNLKSQLVLESEDDFKAISQGMRDSLLNRKSQTDLETYKPLISKKYQEDAVALTAQRKLAQDNFLKEAKKGKNIKTLPSGVVVQTIKKGSGKTPKESSRVKVQYEGSLPDGTIFDSSIKRGSPAQFALNGVISCWREGLQEMKEGGKAKLYCPPDTAYGDAQAGPIPPGSLLVFDVELLSVVDAAPAPKEQAQNEPAK